MTNGKMETWSKIMLMVAVLLIFVVILGIIREYGKRMAMEKRLAELSNELKNLQGQKSGFLSSMDLYDSDLFIEQTARNKFNLKKEGETVVVIKKNESVADQATIDAGNLAAQTDKFSNLNLWWQYFFGDKNIISKKENNL